MNRQDVYALCEEYGYNKDNVFKIELLPDGLVFHLHLRNAEGKKYVIGTKADPAVSSGNGYAREKDVQTIGEIAYRTFNRSYRP